jgi:hypothetical protein
VLAVTASAEGIINHHHPPAVGAVAIDRLTFMIMTISETWPVKRGGGEAAMNIIIIILALDVEVMMMNLVLMVIDIKHHHPPVPAVVAVIAQWTLMLSEMVSVT